MRELITLLLGAGLLVTTPANAFSEHFSHDKHHDKHYGQYRDHSHHGKSRSQQRLKRTLEQPFVRITFTNEADFGQIGQPDGDLLNVTFGNYGSFGHGAGSFLHLGTSVIDNDSTDNEPQQAGRWYLLSVGLTLTPFYGLEIYGGPGWGWSDTLIVPCEECHYETLEGGPKHNEVNWHLGGTYRWHPQIGLSLEYDSAPRALSVGFTFSGK